MLLSVTKENTEIKCSYIAVKFKYHKSQRSNTDNFLTVCCIIGKCTRILKLVTQSLLCYGWVEESKQIVC